MDTPHTVATSKLDLDRTRWPAGPWNDEPDKAQWIDDATGLHCIAVRNSMGNWCGYVALPPGHPWRELAAVDDVADVHGGVTYGPSPCAGNICHTVDHDDDVEWIGFDCAHAGDVVPSMLELRAGYGLVIDGRETYRALPFVIAECSKLAAQAATAGGA